MIWATILLGTIIVYYLIFLLFNFVSLFNNNGLFCGLNDLFFYISLILISVLVSLDHTLKKNTTIYFFIAICLSIPLRYGLITYFSGYFSNTFGYNMIENEADKLFYKIVNTDNNNKRLDELTKLYSKYGPMINNIYNFKPNGLHKDGAKKTNIFKNILLDYSFYDKKKKVKDYLSYVIKNDIIENINEVTKLLDKKYLIAKYIWTLIMILVIFCLSLQYI
jgi:hypothetical protein